MGCEDERRDETVGIRARASHDRQTVAACAGNDTGRGKGPARGQPKTWRYAHFRSYATFEAKKAVLIAVLKRLHKMASDDKALVPSAIQKLHEFTNLEYPAKLIWTACTTLAVTTRNPTWFKIRGAVRKQNPPCKTTGW